MREFQFADMQLFPRAVDLGTLSPAAREGDVPVTASGRHRLPRIRACIEHWAAEFGCGAGRGAKAA